LPDKVTILAESAERRQEIDVERAKSALQRAQERLAATDDLDIDFTRAKAALDRAIHRVRLAEMRMS
jgi:F-type H+-transporting ATPase subunit epsilon